MTFNSPRVFRHMVRLLYVSGDNDLAKRVLRLYVQVVRKARETGTMNEEGEDTHDSSVIESDFLWIQALVQGARMLCRLPGGIEEAKEAISLIESAQERMANLGDEVIASVDLAGGICKLVLASRGRTSHSIELHAFLDNLRARAVNPRTVAIRGTRFVLKFDQAMPYSIRLLSCCAYPLTPYS